LAMLMNLGRHVLICVAHKRLMSQGKIS